MLALRHVSLAYPMLLLSLIACDGSQLVAPSLEAGASSASGPTVMGPSNTNAIAASVSRIDVTWQDNSKNETAFEVWRSPSGLGGTFIKLAGTSANVTTYADAGLKPLTQYCYQARAVRTYDGKTSYSDFSNAACATTPGPPSPPNAPSATNAVPINSSTADLTWADNSANEDGFRVERSLDGGSSWATVSTTVANVMSLRDGGRSSEQQACYRVIAFNASGDSPPSNTDCTTPPAPPTGLTATGLDEPVIDLAWTDNSAVEDGYEVQRSTDGVTFSPVADLPANTTSYRDVGVISNTTHSYQVRAKKDAGFSYFSGVASATAGVLTPPAAPYGLQTYGIAIFPFYIQLSWTDASSNEDGFRIERCDGYCSFQDSWRVIATTGANASYYYDGFVGPGTSYVYRVRAYNRAGDSAPSNEAQGIACDWNCPEL